MYKTIRHGENSLQYTILPQNDDFRIESKLSLASCSSRSHSIINSNKNITSQNYGDGTTRKTSKGPSKRPKRRSFFAYLGLIFVCTVIVGAVLIPFLVSVECLPNPTEWFLKTKAALIRSTTTVTTTSNSNRSNPAAAVSRNRALTMEAVHRTPGEVSLVVPTKLGNNNGVAATVNVEKAVKIVNHNDVEKVVIQMNNSKNISSGGIAPVLKPVAAVNSEPEVQSKNGPNTVISSSAEHFVTEVRFKDVLATDTVAPTIVVTTLLHFNSHSGPEGVAPAAAPTTTTTATPVPKLSSISYPGQRLAITTSSTTINKSSQSRNPIDGAPLATADDIRKTGSSRIIQVPLLKATFKTFNTTVGAIHKNNKSTTGVILEELHDPLMSAAVNSTSNSTVTGRPGSVSSSKDWMHTYWPYIYPSNYFQWNGYKAENSVLLPALLGFALIGVILIIMVCLIVRNKRIIVSSVRKRNRNDIEEIGEDNATLLATANLSDDD